MALPSADTMLTYDLPNPIIDDLQNIIYNIDPAETPFVSNVKQGVATSTLHEWQTDVLAAAADNTSLEGNDPSPKVPADTTRLTNYTQISQKTVFVSDTEAAVKQAGIGDRMAYEMAKAMRELKRDQEYACVGLNRAKAAGSESVVRSFGSVTSWIATNDIFQTGGSPSSGASPAGTGAGARTDNTSTAAFTETMLLNAIDLIWASGGDPSMLLCGSTQKKALTAFTGNATRYKDANDRSIVNAVDVYVSGYGELQVVPDRYIRSRDVLILDPDFWSIQFLRPLTDRPLAKTGDSEKRQLVWEYTLASLNEKSSGGVFDLT